MSFHFSPRSNRAHEITWRPWGAQAFADAQEQDKPIVLAISAVWCHWCHVMDETTYSDPAVIRTINEHFIPIRVDNDQRPDINARYNMGGWPTTAILTPQGMTLTGGTYIPQQQMLGMLDQLRAFYREHQADIRERIGSRKNEPRRMQPASGGELRASMVARVLEEITQAYDDVYGGFGTQPKFPQTEQLELLLLEHRLCGEARLFDMAATTMAGMSQGGMYDHIEGGFFRYSTTRDWSVPHFEKMTEDHAGLLRVLATLLLVRENPEFRATLRSATTYVLSVLRNAESPFFAGSQDADEAYYALPLEERRKVNAPYVDRTVYANWNALLASALYAVATALDDDAIAHDATATVDGLHDHMRDADGLLFHYRPPGETPQARGLLTDQAAYFRALIDAHEHTGEARFIQRAEELAAALNGRFAHEDGPYEDRADMQEQLGHLAFSDRPLLENASIAESFLRLGALTASDSHRARAREILNAYARTYGQAGSFAAGYARSVRRYLESPSTLTIVGEPFVTQGLRKAGRRLSDPLLTIRTVDPADTRTLQERGYSPARAPVAYLCRGTSCAAPIDDPIGLAAAAKQLQVLVLGPHERIPVGASPDAGTD